MQIGVLGAGTWGVALARMLHNDGKKVVVWSALENEVENLFAYLKTCFVRFLVAQITATQHISKSSFSLVPIQDFTKKWTDEELYAKYGLSQEEIDFIESMIKPME